MRLRSTLAALLAPATAVALLATLPSRPEADRGPSSASTERVTSTLLGCPAAPSARGASTRFTYGTAPAGSGRPGGRAQGTLSLGGVGAAPTDGDAARGRRVLPEAADANGLVALGTGEVARELFAGREDRTGAGPGTLASTTCNKPAGEWWFAGAGAGIDHASELSLSNVDAGPAVVDVDIHGATGNVDLTSTRGVTLAPGETVRLPLAELAPGSEEVTVHVDATRGRVVAAVSDLRSASGESGAGREWLPTAAPPAKEVHLAGIPGGSARRVLLVTNPGEQQAVVAVEVLGPDGAFVPLGKEQLSIDPGSVGTLELTEEIGDAAAAVRLLSDTVEVIGTVRSVAAGDHAYAGQADALTGPTVLAASGDRSSVQLSGGDAPTSVRVTAYTATGRPGARRDLTVPPSGLLEWQLPPGAAYAVIVPRSGSLFAAAVHRGPGIAAEPGRLLPLTVRRPVVRLLGQPAS